MPPQNVPRQRWEQVAGIWESCRKGRKTQILIVTVVTSKLTYTHKLTLMTENWDYGEYFVVIDSYFLCSHICSFRKQSAEQEAEAGLRGDHSMSKGGHTRLGEDAGNSCEGKGQIRCGNYTCCCSTRYKFSSTNTYVNASQKCLFLAQSLQVSANIA